MSRFVIFKCRLTMELYQLALREDAPVWIPLLHRLGDPVAAMPGYIFVLEGEHISFRRWAPERYALSALEYDAAGRAKSCDVALLTAMQQEINVPTDHSVFEVNELVNVCEHHPFLAGRIGRAVSVSQFGARIELKGTRLKYFNVPRELLRKCPK